ncbi:MAG: phosphodiesterase [Pikeienuella sp.]
MKLLHLTDIHLTTPGQTISGRDPNANFERALTHAIAHHPDAEAMVITGDLSDWGDRADYLRLRQRVAQLPLPVHLCIGNHDERATFLEVFPDSADRDAHVQSAAAVSGGTLILLDTWGPETHAGHFCARRAAWLDEVLADAAAPVFLFMHHPPLRLGIAPMDQIGLLDCEPFGDVVARHRSKIAHIACGHVHLPVAGSFHGIPVSVSRGTNHAAWAAFGETERLVGSDLPEAYAVILAEGPSVTVTMVEFGYEGPVRRGPLPDYASWDRTAMDR